MLATPMAAMSGPVESLSASLGGPGSDSQTG